MINLNVRAYEQAALDLIALMVNSSDVCIRVEAEFGVMPEHMPDVASQRAYMAIRTLRKMGYHGDLNDNLIVDMAQHGVTHDWINQRIFEGLDKNGQLDSILLLHLESNAQIVLENGKHNLLCQLLSNELTLLRAGQSVDATFSKVITGIVTSGTSKAIENEHAEQHGTLIEQLLDSPPPPMIETGINCIDDLVGGVCFNRLWSLVSAYKMRKTTTALNMALGVLFTNPDARVSIYSREMEQVEIGFKMIAMIANAWLLKQGLATDDNTHISDDGIRFAGNNYKRWKTPHKAQAVSEAIRIYKELGKRLQIYDKTVGEMRTMQDAERLFKRSIALYGTPVHIFDYFGMLGIEGEGIYNQSAARAERFLDMSKNAAVIVLAQKNEEGVKSDGSGNHSAAAKGGNDLPAASAYVWTTRYKAKETPHKLTLELQHSRFSPSRKTDVDINPFSGLILDASWMNKV